MGRIGKSKRAGSGALLLLWGFSVSSLLAGQQSSSKPLNNNFAAGRNTYDASCAACHGLDGRGSDKAINIAAGSEVQHLSDVQLSAIIWQGVPGTGMPAFRNLSRNQIEAVVLYLRSLQGMGQARALPGDAARGKEIFFGKGECSNCHMIAGHGGFLGPDLSAYASTSSPQAIREEIARPERNPRPGYRLAVLTTASGDELEGLIRNEDNFSVQFQTRDGNFHFFQKSELQKLERVETSLMPTNYGERLSSREIDDLVIFLTTTCPDANKAGTTRKKKYEDE
jgi:cytochrome c oxidase cbb3-type subunit 3